MAKFVGPGGKSVDPAVDVEDLLMMLHAITNATLEYSVLLEKVRIDNNIDLPEGYGGAVIGSTLMLIALGLGNDGVTFDDTVRKMKEDFEIDLTEDRND